MVNIRVRQASADWAQPGKDVKRPSDLPHGGWLGDFGELSDAEKFLLECCANGNRWTPEGSTNERPSKATESNLIRAELIRFLALGGDSQNPVHEEGVMITGAWVSGRLSLHQCKVEFQLSIEQSHFEDEISLRSAYLPELSLSGSEIQGLLADGLIVTGDIFLRNGFKSNGSVRLLGARIQGDVSLVNAEVGRDNEQELNAQDISVEGGLLMRGSKIHCPVTLTAARIGTLVDDGNCWETAGHLLDGLQYDRIIGPMVAKGRIDWLNKQRQDQLDDRDFSPQPWEQLARVLREMGHTGAAAEVAIAKQDAMRKAGQVGQRQVKDFSEKRFADQRSKVDELWNPVSNWLSRQWHILYGALSGYGYRPQRIVYLMVASIIISAVLYYAGQKNGLIGPSDPLVQLVQATEKCGPNKVYWTDRACPMPPEYSTFQPLSYAIDVTLPLVDLHQEADWGPIVLDNGGDTLWGGQLLRLLMWFNIIFGWFASLMFVAIVSRLVDKD